ncbi:transcriptional regulator GlxA family with amidase domain [Kutzneria viridogrisea]|nr:helix-turn-helix domain-containing protein [Kutzneria albida]MBA8928590.1 transcriptional regulator GlxA family with amidase domain [Kutzneria viridogrisea]
MRTGKHTVVVLALDGVVAFDLGIASRVLNSADQALGGTAYEVLTCTADGGPVRTTAGFALLPGHGPEVLERADTVIVPGPCEGPLVTSATLPGDLVAALARVPAKARWVSICTGAFVLAAAGLLDGRPATTHWMHTETFRALHPRVQLNPDVLFVDDGDVLTSAGAAAGIDLCLHIVRRDHGSEIANQVARRTVVPAWRDGGQSQYIERPLPEVVDSSTAATRRWLTEHLHEQVDLRGLAATARMSVRTFTRRFREETGMSPGQWLLRQRVERARHLLESTELSVERIAREAGFGTTASLRQHLNSVLGVSPSAYRRAFTGRRPARRAG